MAYKEDLSPRGLSLQGMVGDYNNLWIIGQPIDINFSMMTQGVYQLDEEAEAAKYGARPGHYKPLDLNKDGEITDADRVINGKHTPDFTGGMTNTFTYKDFDLSFQLSFQTGAKVYTNTWFLLLWNIIHRILIICAGSIGRRKIPLMTFISLVVAILMTATKAVVIHGIGMSQKLVRHIVSGLLII